MLRIVAVCCVDFRKFVTPFLIMETKIEQYISELLYKHECVIVPQFGGFVARHLPASITNEGSLISPPAKSILFNKNLQNNDGLLVNFVMEAESLSYNEANEQVMKFAHYCSANLQSKQRVEISGVGVLFMNAEQSIQFEPQVDVNYLIESFGLFSINAEEIVAAKTDKIIELSDRKVVVENNNSSSRKYLRIAAVSLAAPMLALGIFFSLTNTQMKNKVTSAFGISTESNTYEKSNYKNAAYTYTSKPAPNVIVDANGYAGIALAENDYIFVNVSDTVVADKTVVKKVLHHVVKSSTNGKYKIVVGCFSVEENAQRLVNTLHDRNISASITGKNKNGLHVVSAGSTNNMDEARTLLQTIRQNYPSAWMMTGN
jgi:nucleoid DNA-binding protein